MGCYSPQLAINHVNLKELPLVQMVVESSNVSSLQEMVNLVTVSRAYEMAKKVVEVHDDTMGKAIQSLGAPIA